MMTFKYSNGSSKQRCSTSGSRQEQGKRAFALPEKGVRYQKDLPNSSNVSTRYSVQRAQALNDARVVYLPEQRSLGQ